MTIELLRLAKKRYTYRELSSKLGLPVTVLSRYVRGHVLPTGRRAREIWTALSKFVSLRDEIAYRLKFDEMGYFDNTNIITDISLLSQAAHYALRRFAGKRVTKILTAAVDGIPLATIVANTFGVDLLVAKKEKEVGVHEFLEEVYIPGDSAVMVSLFLPKKALKKADNVLIVDDVIRTGETQRALIKLVERAKAEVAGIFVLIAIGDGWKKLEARYTVEAVLKLLRKT